MTLMPPLEEQVGQLGLAVRRLAIIGAALKIRNNPEVDPGIAALIRTGATSLLGRDVGTLDEKEVLTLLRMIEMSFAEGGELLHDPARPAQWSVVDPVLLQTQGQASARSFQRIRALAGTRELLEESLRGRFLDIGTGVAGIALEAARSCPSLLIDGIDVWEPALALARRNVEDSPYADRVRILNLDVTQLPEQPAYTLIWLPTMFMKKAVVEGALERICAAAARNAWIVAATYTVPSDPEGAAFVALRTLRSGGEPLTQADLEGMLHAHGFVDIEHDVSPLATYTLGRRP